MENPFIFLLILYHLFISSGAVPTTPQQWFSQLASAGNGVIKLNADTFDILTSPKRTWEFDPSFQAVAKAWSNVSPKTRDEHFFATLDFEDGSSVFQKTSGIDPAPLAEFLSDHTPVAIPYKAPIDWRRYTTITLEVLAAAVLLRFLFPIINNRWTWAAGVVITCLAMTSGYMFSRIKNVPFNAPNGNWIALGHQNQFGQEVQAVAFLYGTLAFSLLALMLVVPYQSPPQYQRFQVYFWTVVIMIVYSVLISVYRVKNRAYPFKLFH
ncbi:hypothetical protein CVT24_005214 [Panaeolus cyanescens]|uniref:Oligosaccharyl transferase subunit OST3/OST6 family n=1 Tax=Panaeolus cyanescens TaxID=181874 RepID=A0A409Y977_9AGAR|nr:hypothetical protein CVT24_005214 [Panaeolus cyanescens]